MIETIQYAMITDLPKALLAYTTSAYVQTLNDAIVQENLITEAQREALYALEGDILMRVVPLAQVKEEITRRFACDADRALKIAARVWNEFCAPIKWYFPHFEDEVKAAGGSVSGDVAHPIAQPTITYDTAVATVMKIVADLPPRAHEKVEVFVKSLLRGTTFDADTIMRHLHDAVTDGGFGVNEKSAWNMTQHLQEYVAVYALTEGALTQAPLAEPPTSALQPHEVADVAAMAAAAQTVASSSAIAQENALIESVLALEPFGGYTDEIKKRWHMIVEARVKGVRDAAATATLIGAPEDAGGFGLAPEDAARLTTLLEKTVSGFATKRTEFSVTEKIASVQKEVAGLAVGPDEKQAHTQKELNDRFVNMFGRDAVAHMRDQSRIREIETVEAAHPTEQRAVAQPLPPKQHVAPAELAEAVVVSGAPRDASVAPPIAHDAPSIAPKYVPKIPEKLKQLIDAENPILPTKKIIVSPPLPTKPKTGDIRTARAVLGPIDELHYMTIVDFRRLSPEPLVRIQKIRSKIEVIGEDGALEKIRAVQAFEQSEPVRVYRDALKQSLLQHKSVDEIFADRKIAGEPTLDPMEYLMIQTFVKEIRYLTA